MLLIRIQQNKTNVTSRHDCGNSAVLKWWTLSVANLPSVVNFSLKGSQALPTLEQLLCSVQLLLFEVSVTLVKAPSTVARTVDSISH